MKIGPVGAELFRADRQKYRRTNIQDETNSCFRNFANTPKTILSEKWYEKVTWLQGQRLESKNGVLSTQEWNIRF